MKTIFEGIWGSVTIYMPYTLLPHIIYGLKKFVVRMNLFGVPKKSHP